MLGKKYIFLIMMFLCLISLTAVVFISRRNSKNTSKNDISASSAENPSNNDDNSVSRFFDKESFNSGINVGENIRITPKAGKKCLINGENVDIGTAVSDTLCVGN